MAILAHVILANVKVIIPMHRVSFARAIAGTMTAASDRAQIALAALPRFSDNPARGRCRLVPTDTSMMRE
jgi:hypothetical protein